MLLACVNVKSWPWLAGSWRGENGNSQRRRGVETWKVPEKSMAVCTGAEGGLRCNPLQPAVRRLYAAVRRCTQRL